MTRRLHDIMEISVIVQRRTEKAILVQNLKEENVWLPLSQVECDNDGIGPAEVQLPEWLAVEKELV